MKKGIDVSKHQGVIDWKKVAADGVEFAILRAGYGMYENQVDPQFVRNAKCAAEVGIPIGAYWYSYAVTVEEGIREAECFLKTIREFRFAYPLFFDQEYEPGIKALTKETRTAICKAFITRVTEAGYNCGIYASKDWLENMIDAGALGDVPFWVAQYGDKLTYKGRCDIWQFTSTGRVNGINGNVDKNESYVDFAAEKPEKAGYVTSPGKWEKTAKGWKFITEDGSKTGGKWLKYQGGWYFFGPDEIALTGSHEIDGVWYYFMKEAAAPFKECQALETAK